MTNWTIRVNWCETWGDKVLAWGREKGEKVSTLRPNAGVSFMYLSIRYWYKGRRAFAWVPLGAMRYFHASRLSCGPIIVTTVDPFDATLSVSSGICGGGCS